MYAVEFPAGDRQVARPGGADGQQHGVVLGRMLVKLHIGNAVSQQAAGAVVAFVNNDRMAGLIKLGGGG